MIKKIVTVGNPILSSYCYPVEKFDKVLRSLVTNLFDTMRAAHGAGLAAPQIGEQLRVVVIDSVHPLVLINPEILAQHGEQIDTEGCLSIPGLRIKMRRPETVKVSYQTEDGLRHELEVHGMEARVVCHEVDHLDGKLITDYVFEAL